MSKPGPLLNVLRSQAGLAVTLANESNREEAEFWRDWIDRGEIVWRQRMDRDTQATAVNFATGDKRAATEEDLHA